MSSAHDAHGAPAHAHDAHDAFDGEPVKVLAPGEPLTPAWLPLVGLALFACVGVAALAGGDPAEGTAAPKPLVAPEPQAPAPVAPAAAPPRGPASAAPGNAAPPGSAAVRKLTPDQLEQLRKRIDEAQKNGVGKKLPLPGH